MLQDIYAQTYAYYTIYFSSVHNIHFIFFKHLLHNRVTQVKPWDNLDYAIVEKMCNKEKQ